MDNTQIAFNLHKNLWFKNRAYEIEMMIQNIFSSSFVTI